MSWRPDPAHRLSRRHWLQALLASASLQAWQAGAHPRSAPGLADLPFALGVASGTPSHQGVVLWTRLAVVDPLDPRVHTVRWELAEDEGFQRIVQRGQTETQQALGHAVHVELQGLPADRWFHYRFMVGDAVSPVGRTRTLPAPDSPAGRLRLAFASCQRWEHGYYAAWRHAAAQSLDLVVFLGDYIYEYASPRSGLAPQAATPIHRVHELRRAVSLADYRDRYALHKSDPDLQAAHAACPWLLTWDDHEVENDYAGLQGREGASAEFMAQRAAAYQAFYENMPLPASVLVQGLQGLNQADALRLYQRHAFGRLARFHVLDDRQYRAVQACRNPSESSAGTVRPSRCAELRDPSRSLLGAAQEQWLAQGLAQDSRPGGPRWTVLAQQTLFSPRHYGGASAAAQADEPTPTDPWDGYPGARQRLLHSLQATPPRNTVLIGGDIHQNYVCRVHADPDRPDSPVLASEFCGTSISSHSGATLERAQALQKNNPHVLLANPEQRGYALVELNPQRWQTTLMAVDQPGRADSALRPLARFVVEDGRAGPQRES
ncbi:alkaline phosphatase D family protein [Curvibacter microcysteis]|uniref:alkaline phosphatase D family protein n=1 Tax=Curvibacter microcysteis TaxID=3026419 RepID=UPI003905ECFD